MERAKKLWNRNFTVLWQGQLISDLGNAAFAVALGFWVLAVTKSPKMPDGDMALFGLVEACFALPAVLLGPFAGVLADRISRKQIIIAADFIRGVLFTIMGVLVILGVFPLWAIFPIALLAGASGAFFGPAISSAIPDIVDKDNLAKANSARGLSSTVSQLLGNSFGGVLFAALGAPVLFLANGISFLYASATQTLMRIPRVAQAEKKHILQDLLDGFLYTFRSRGVRTLVLTGMLINFFAVCGMTLLTPLFSSTPGFGSTRYGFMMATMMVGMATGMILLSSVKILPQQRASVFGAAVAVMVATMVPIGFIYNVVWLFPLAFVAGFTNAIVNVMVQTTMQTTVVPEHRGKVFGIMHTVMGGLQPVAMAASGLGAHLFGTRAMIIGCFSVLVFTVLPFLFDRSFKTFINTDLVSQQHDDGNQLADSPALVSEPTPVIMEEQA